MKTEEIDLSETSLPMPKLIKDLGMKYPNEKSKKKRHYGLYECGLCGKHFEARTDSIKHGDTQSCGCYNKIQVRKTNTTHAHSKHPLYRVWNGIKNRTGNPKTEIYKDYGGRGITMCDEWKDSFETFYIFCMAKGWEKGLEIDRIDVNNGYYPENCRFVTRSINAQNTRQLRSNNTSGYRGVSCHKASGKWMVQIIVTNKHIYLGLFKTALEGAIAYDKYVIENNLAHTINGVI